MKAGWKTVKLGHIGVHVKGSSMPAKESRFESWSVPSFETGQPEIVNGSSILAAKTPVEVGDVLICKINPRINRVWRVTETGNNLPRICSTEWVVFRANNPSEVLPQWVQIYCSSPAFREWITGQITGTTGSHARAKPSNIFDQEIPLPPLAEQKRIVALLDEAFTGIDEAMAKAEDCASDVRELYRESVGSIFLRMSEKEPSCALGDVCGFVRGPFGGSLKKQHFVAKGYAVYEQQHAIYDQFSEIRYFVSESKYKEMKRFELSPGDLIMSCSGTMGRVAIVPDGIIPGIINQALLKLTPGEKIQAIFLKCWMESSSFQDALKKYAGGAAIQNVASVKILKAIMMPLPSAVEQANLVRSINGLREETERAAHVFEMKIESLKELKKSFLTQAFAGELTA